MNIFEQVGKAILDVALGPGKVIYDSVNSYNDIKNQKHDAEVNGVGQSIPPDVYKAYKAGKLDRWLKNGRGAWNTKDEILEAYEHYARTGPKYSGDVGNNKDDGSISEIGDHPFANGSTKADNNESNSEDSKPNQVTIVNTPMAYEAGVNAGILPSIEEMNPYIITIDQNSGTQDYTGLRELGVQGVAIDMGSYFSPLHTVNSSFQQPKLKSQIEAANEANMPYGLFTTIRSRSIEEAKLELFEIKLVVRKYQPKNGLWFKLGMSSDTYTNNKILEYYYTYLENLGFKDQIGIYASKEQLKQISWSKFYEDWYLWLDEHVDSLTEIPHPVTPDFFMCREVS